MGDKQVSDLHLLDMNAEPDAPMNVVTSLRLPADLKRRVDAAAADQGISPSTFIRRAIESALAGRDKGNLVNLDDVIRAIKSVPHAA
jgi:predicted DNA-binding protein